MADPISSLGPNTALDCHADDHAATSSVAEPTQSAVPASSSLVCTAEAASSSAPPAGAESLVARFSPPPALPKPVASGALPVISHSSLTTSSGAVPGGGSYRVAANVFQAQVETSALKGSRLEVGTAIVQYGDDNDLQVVLARRSTMLSGHGFGVTLTGEVGTLRANLGEHNDDGSIGGNIGAGAELAGAEVTVDTPVGSLTYGQGASLGASGSMGVRDADHDGKLELCAKFSIPEYTVGACVEEFW